MRFRMRSLGVLVACAAVVGCSSSENSRSNGSRATSTDKSAESTGSAATGETPSTAEADSDNPLKVDGWVPAEHKKGAGRFKEAWVYLDGKPIGVLARGEVAPDLAKIIVEHVEEERMIGEREASARVISHVRYRLTDYLSSLGVNVRSIRELHLFGAGGHAIRVTQEMLREHGDELEIRVGRRIAPMLPKDMPRNTKFDKLDAVLLYVNKRPPVVNDQDRPELDGKPVDGIPYHAGDPLRGGIRVYRNHRLAGVIKRNLIAGMDKLAYWSPDGKELRWKLFPFLRTLGVDTRGLVALDIIFDEQRTRRISGRAELEELYFTSSPQSRGAILLGGERIPTSGFAFYTEGRLPNEVAQAAAAPTAPTVH